MSEFTDNEIKIIKACDLNEYGSASEGDIPWVFAVIAYSGLDAKTARGVIASLVKKEIVVVEDYEGKGRANDMVISFTDKGLAVALQIINA